MFTTNSNPYQTEATNGLNEWTVKTVKTVMLKEGHYP